MRKLARKLLTTIKGWVRKQSGCTCQHMHPVRTVPQVVSIDDTPSCIHIDVTELETTDREKILVDAAGQVH